MTTWTSDELARLDDAGDAINADLDAAYHAEYRRYSSPVASITSPLARSETLKVITRQQLQEGTAR